MALGVCRQQLGSAAAAERARVRKRHSEYLLRLIQAGIEMRLIRRHRLDDPRLSDEVRAMLARTAVERKRKLRRARQLDWRNPNDWAALFSGGALANFLRHLDPPPAPARAARSRIASHGYRVTIELVQNWVREHFRQLERDPNVRSNRCVVVFPRQVAMYIARQLTRASVQEIGRQFGGKHHTTVLHSINKIEQMRRSDQGLDRAITEWMDALRER